MTLKELVSECVQYCRTISKRSRDNLPNPIPKKGNAYVPSNSPAIGDLFDLFDFSKKISDND